MTKFAPILALLLLAGCASEKLPVAEIQTQQVLVPVRRLCVADLGPTPTFPDTNKDLRALPFPDAARNLRAHPNDAVAAKQVKANINYVIRVLSAGRLMHMAWEDQLTTALNGCTRE